MVYVHKWMVLCNHSPLSIHHTLITSHMTISWYGQGCFVLKSSSNNHEALVVIDPFDPKIGLTPPKTEADILLVSHDHFDHNNISAIKGAPFLIKEPGEYELKNVFVEGFEAFHDNSQGKERGKVIIFVITMEEVRICHLSDLGQKELTQDQIDKIGQIDILLIPVGGKYTIDGQEAREIVNQLDPKIVIPMHYKVPKLTLALDDAEKFLKALGVKEPRKEKKLKVQKKDLTQEEETEIVILEPLG